jgi:hypothetical protein
MYGMRRRAGRATSTVSAATLLCAIVPLLPAGAAAQEPVRINIYRYILDMDVPEPAALIALDAAPSRVLRGSMPKPLAAGLMHQHAGGDWRTGAVVEAAPYFVLGGGVRSLAAHRAMTPQGRLMRVLTKTVVSMAGLPVSGSASYDFGVGVRSTLHDPHDPTTGSRLPEQVDSILRVTGAALPIAATDLRGVIGDFQRVFAAAERAMRARGGDVQVAAGWGLARLVDGGDDPGHAERRTRHTLWLTGQHTRGPRTDLLATVQLLDAFDGDRNLRVGAGIQTKAPAVDLRTELFYDATDGRLHPGVAVEAHLLPGVGAAVALSREVGSAEDLVRPLRLAALVRWYFVTRY